jgi:hypothetical protein
VICYHGGPITPLNSAVAVWSGRHAMVSFCHPEQIGLAAEITASFTIDNGAFSFWRQDGASEFPLKQFVEFAKRWQHHPSLDWIVAPDVIGGSEGENDQLLGRFQWAMPQLPENMICPVWHLDESVERLSRLSREYSRVALGSSGEYRTPGSDRWWERMAAVMDDVCDEEGRPPCKLHGLRMLNPTIFSQIPFSSADSTNVAQNNQNPSRWIRGGYQAVSPEGRALVLRDRIESHAAAVAWNREARHLQLNLFNPDLIG